MRRFVLRRDRQFCSQCLQMKPIGCFARNPDTHAFYPRCEDCRAANATTKSNEPQPMIWPEDLTIDDSGEV